MPIIDANGEVIKDEVMELRALRRKMNTCAMCTSGYLHLSVKVVNVV